MDQHTLNLVNIRRNFRDGSFRERIRIFEDMKRLFVGMTLSFEAFQSIGDLISAKSCEEVDEIFLKVDPKKVLNQDINCLKVTDVYMQDIKSLYIPKTDQFEKLKNKKRKILRDRSVQPPKKRYRKV